MRRIPYRFRRERRACRHPFGRLPTVLLLGGDAPRADRDVAWPHGPPSLLASLHFTRRGT